jgi:hypothetical protein
MKKLTIETITWDFISDQVNKFVYDSTLQTILTEVSDLVWDPVHDTIPELLWVAVSDDVKRKLKQL